MSAYRFVAHSGYCPHCGQILRRADDDLVEEAVEYDPVYETVLNFDFEPDTFDVEMDDEERYAYYQEIWDTCM